jgi:hypothetical protein
LPLKNKTNQLFLSFICCRLGRSRIAKKKKKKKRQEKKREKYGKNIKKNPRKKNNKKRKNNLVNLQSLIYKTPI